MRETFGDAAFFIALLNARDELHAQAQSHAANLRGVLVTTDAVLIEVANFLTNTSGRRLFKPWLDAQRASTDFVVIRTDHDLFDRGLNLYADRPDKQWSLTDCISFVVMRDRGMSEALTGDRHFEQVGFRPLLA